MKSKNKTWQVRIQVIRPCGEIMSENSYKAPDDSTAREAAFEGCVLVEDFISEHVEWLAIQKNRKAL